MGIVRLIVEQAGEYAVSEPSALASGQAGPALEEVFRLHHPRIVDMLARLTGDRGQAEDIAGDVFCKLARRGSISGVGEGLASWVYRVAANAGFDALRSGARRRRREEAAGVESLRAAEPTGALEDLLRAERRARVRQTLAALKPRDARLLLLRSGGAAYREIAEALGIAPASVGTLLARAEAAFERKFRARYGDWK
jgi:RNA polymerase sigma-70 factor (ECF subfamily)